MSITVKKLIAELEKIENKFLEVQVYGAASKGNPFAEIESVKVNFNRKTVLIFVKDKD